MGKTKIEWVKNKDGSQGRTWNPVTGCTPISPGCANCYAKRMAERFAGPWGLDPADPFKVRLKPERLDEPLRWKKPSRVFVCSMSDLFHDDVPEKFIIDALSIMAEAWQQTFLILTKRPERMAEIFNGQTVANDVWLQTSRGVNAEKSPWPLPNVWLGVTAENQEQADKRIPILLRTAAAKRFVSVEPMLGPVDLTGYHQFEHPDNEGYGAAMISGLDWVICGGESGSDARPMHLDWVRSLRDQCRAAWTPFLFKQWGEWYGGKETPKDFKIRPLEPKQVHWIDLSGDHWPVGQDKYTGTLTSKMGKKAAGRLLDGKLWDQYPDVPS